VDRDLLERVFFTGTAMGSMIHLALGRLELDWGKNSGFVDYSALFQAGDVGPVPYYYAAELQPGETATDGRDWKVVVEFHEGLSKPLGQVLDRIDLLGHTAAVCEREFAYHTGNFEIEQSAFPFSALRKALAAVDVTALSADYGEGGEDFGKFFRREVAPRLKLTDFAGGSDGVPFDVPYAMENLTAFTVLHLLADNPTARNLPVQWAFNDVREGGWARREDFVRTVDPANRFLIVTEGSSDAAILKKAFRLLRPHIADFFDFVDMEEGYPFSGTGNVYRFVQGLISIAVLNNVLVLFDNDAEGCANYARCLDLNVPANMRIRKLPDLDVFERFTTVGPGGEHQANINGQAAAIECYLDLPADACVRWTSFVDKADCYQGELIGKDRHKKRFLDQRTREDRYGYSKLSRVLDVIVAAAVDMRERVASEGFALHNG
jgi:hypothetical protein